MGDRSRMLAMLLISIVLYALALAVTLVFGTVPPEWAAQVQLVSWKLGHVTMAAHVGYWVARQALGRITWECSDSKRIARAIIIGAAMLAVAQGL